MHIILYSIILFLMNRSTLANQPVPVIVLENGKIMSHLILSNSPFHKTSKHYFIEIISYLSRTADKIVIFTEDYLCTEDLSIKDEKGTPYNYLRESILLKEAAYIPSVIDPYKAITDILEPHQDTIYLVNTKTSKAQIFQKIYKYYYVNFEDKSNQTRSKMLRDHDSIIKDMFTILKELFSGDVVAIYTGKLNPVYVPRLQLKEAIKDPSNEILFIPTDAALFKLSGLTRELSRSTKYDMPLRMPEDIGVTSSPADRTVIVRFPIELLNLEFSFSYDDKRWILNSIALIEEDEEVGSTDLRFGAKWGVGYACAEPIHVVNLRDYSVFNIDRYQIELLQNFTKGQAVMRSRFDKSDNCGPYFSHGIVSCLFLSGILISILLYGFMVIINCRSNSRYDDPKGNQLIKNSD